MRGLRSCDFSCIGGLGDKGSSGMMLQGVLLFEGLGGDMSSGLGNEIASGHKV